MATLNRTSIIGHLGNNPELRQTNTTGKSVCNFSVAVNDSWKDKATGTKMERTSWFRVVCWAGLAEVVAANMSTGKQVYVEGRMEEDTYQVQHKDPVSGQPMFYANGQPIMENHRGWKLIARDVQFLGKKGDNSAYAQPAGVVVQPAAVAAVAPVADPLVAAPVAAPVVAAVPGTVATTFVGAGAQPAVVDNAVPSVVVAPPAGV